MATSRLSPAGTSTFAKPRSWRAGPKTPPGARAYSCVTSAPSTSEVFVIVKRAPRRSTLRPEYSKSE